MIKINQYLAVSSYDNYLESKHPDFIPDLILLCAKEIVIQETGWDTLSCEPATARTDIVKFDIIDGNLLSLLTRIDEILSKLISALGEGQRVLVCCQGSLSRSMTIIMYYLITQKNQIYSPQIGTYFMSVRQGQVVDWKIHPVFEKFLKSL